MRFGKGRLIAGQLQDDLRQSYKETKKFGTVFPLIYNSLVCPSCWFAALPEDFFVENIFDRTVIVQQQKQRRLFGQQLLPTADFAVPRTLETGLLSFFLAISCYASSPQKSFAQAKKSMAAIRASWCAHDLMLKYPHETYQELKIHFRLSCLAYLKKHLELFYVSQRNKIHVTNFGPDLGVDYGFNGLVYLKCFLASKFLHIFKDNQSKYKELNSSRIFLSKVFGLGKSSKSSPSPLLGKSKKLYDSIKMQLDEFEKKGISST